MQLWRLPYADSLVSERDFFLLKLCPKSIKERKPDEAKPQKP